MCAPTKTIITGIDQILGHGRANAGKSSVMSDEMKNMIGGTLMAIHPTMIMQTMRKCRIIDVIPKSLNHGCV